MRRNSLCRLLACLLLSAASLLPAWAAPVRFAGRVINGTRGDAPAAGAAIRLLRLDTETGKGQTLATAKSNARGDFDMGRLNVPADDLLFARIEWNGYPYVEPAFDGGGRLEGANIQPDRLSLRVYDTTPESPPLVFTAHHIAVKSEGANLKCIERMVIENPSNRTYVGGDEGVTILLPLPKGAKDVRLDADAVDARLVKVGSVYGVAKPILPAAAGVRNALIVEYSMPWAREGVNLSRRLQYPVKFFFVAREQSDSKLQVTAPRLGAVQETQLPLEGQMQTRLINAIGSPQNPQPALKAGDEVQVVVSRAVNPLVWAFVAFVGVLFLAVPLTLLRSRNSRSRLAVQPANNAQSDMDRGTSSGAKRSGGSSVKIAEPGPQASVIPGILADGTELSSPLAAPSAAREWIDKIALLDDDWEAGKLEQNEYQRRRAAWKQKVVELWSAEAE